MSDMGRLSHSEATASCISDYAEPDRRSIRSIRTLNGRTNKFGWLQAPATKLLFFQQFRLPCNHPNLSGVTINESTRTISRTPTKMTGARLDSVEKTWNLEPDKF